MYMTHVFLPQPKKLDPKNSYKDINCTYVSAKIINTKSVPQTYPIKIGKNFIRHLKWCASWSALQTL